MTNDRKKVIYLLYTYGDVWKSRNTEKLLVATTSRKKLKMAVVRAIHNDLMAYDDGTEPNKKQQLKMFREDFEKELRSTINDRLRFGAIDYCYDGEEI